MKKEIIDVKIVEKLKDGDKKSYNHIYEHYKYPIYYFVLGLVKNASDADDITQETFIKAFKNVHQLKVDSAFHSWLFSIAYNTSKGFLIKRNKLLHIHDEINIENIIHITDKQISDLNYKELVKQIQNSINNMDDKHKDVATLRFLEELSLAEISEILEIPIGTVKSRLSKIRDTIKVDLYDYKYNQVN